MTRALERRWLPPLLLSLPIVWLLRRGLFLGELFAFRDAAHYYYPLYKYIHVRWQSGLPLWNPLDSIGQPLLGDPTAAVLYPAKLIFCFPCEFSLCFVLYVAMHIWWAAYGAFLCARKFGAGGVGALLAGYAYSLSGQIVFQYCNPIFLVGAAWLPWSVLAFESALVHHGKFWPLLLAAFLSMMVLGGDPQLAYHFVVIAAFRLCLSDRSTWWPGAVVLSAAAFLAVLLSAVQVLPSAEWSSHSDRALLGEPRSIWEWSVRSITKGDLASTRGFWSRGEMADGHSNKIYDFSVGPWRWPELFAPNISGSWFPLHGRWIMAFPGESRTWVPSLYMGLMPIGLALFRLRLRGGRPRTRWLSWLLLGSVLAGLGEFGLGWLVNELQYWRIGSDDFEQTTIMPGFGGVYWLLTVVLPKYLSFRYPAKWWTIAAFAICLLASTTCSVPFSRYRKAFLRRLRLLCGVTLLPMIVAAVWVITINNVPSNSIFGPFSGSLAKMQVAGAVMHTALIFIVMLLFPRRRHLPLLVAVTALELCVAQASLIQTCPLSSWQAELGEHGSCIYRCEPGRAYPRSWKQTSSRDRFGPLVQSDSATLMPKHHLLSQVRSIRTATCMTTADYWAIWQVACPEFYDVPSLEMLRAIGAQEAYVPAVDYSLAPKPWGTTAETNLVRVSVPDALPRAWLTTRWETLPEVSDRDRLGLIQRTRDVLHAQLELADPQQTTVLETDDQIPESVSATDHTMLATSQVELDEPERIRIRCTTPVPAVLVLRDQFYPGWNASVETSGKQPASTTILRANRVMRGVLLESGEHVVEFRYDPSSIFWGLWISSATWCLWIGSMLASVAQRSTR